MALSSGTFIGPYEIVTLIGAGGMGEVYSARDTRLARDVAVKILPAVFSTDPDRVRRFELEARAAAALNHPNILGVHDVGHHDGTWYVVSELLEGQTLRERLGASALPVRKAVEYGIQIANGLAAAHEKGIVHRDLKPENVFITRDERVKILDFGLAKLTDSGASALTMPGSAAGVVLGTVGYMSPEQARGVTADHRSDIFSFGAVLFEMMTGRRAFARATPAQTMTAILEEDPAETAAPASPLGARIMGLVRRCLDKSPQGRFQSAGDLALVLTHELTDSGLAHAPANPKAIRRMAPAVGLAAVFTTVGLGLGRWLGDRPEPSAVTPVAFTLSLAASEQLALSGHPLAISQDGRHIAYAAVRDGQRRLFLRALDKSEAVAVSGADNATHPVFSPDGASIAFFADGWLKRVPITGGVSTTIAAAPAPRGLAWGSDDRIVFTPHASSGLLRVPASGGVPESLTELDLSKGETNHRWPVALPDGSGVLYTVQGRSRTEMQIEGLSFRSGARTVVRADGIPVQYLGTGHLVYVAVNGDTFAAPFDPSRLAVTGPALPLPERPARISPVDVGLVLSAAGTMVTLPFEESTRSLVVVGRDGESRTLAAPSRNYFQVKVSPSGRRVAVVIQVGIAEWDIWTLDPTGEMPLTRATVGRFNMHPVWEPDDATLMYSAFEDRTWKLLSRNVDRNDPPRQLLSALPEEPILFGWLPGRSLAYTINLPQQTLYMVNGGEQPRAIPPPATGQFLRILHGLSPDGRWLAYVSNQTGELETYITAFPEGGATRRVSRNGGDHPVWAKTGLQLFYRRSPEGKPGEVLRVTVNPDGSTSAPTLVLAGNYVSERGTYDVFPDGSFLMLEDDTPAVTPHLEVVVNWPALRGLARD